ncbi:hypothetical protein [Pseudoalteromonas piratica]|uniref:Uncharacterized protein n=1 Tax=Pseudoalteromonas piratica TaxID=1348114 RepID=A0A0A7EEZ3_9GAMM|nr:hypothetical protein [Pseudoalteromonas piratica]AIY64582.1 hypothetical protein OM33_05025 [Pseudoalteromonas piratica]
MIQKIIKKCQSVFESLIYVSRDDGLINLTGERFSQKKSRLLNVFSIRLLTRNEVKEKVKSFPITSSKELVQAIKLYKETTFDLSVMNVVYYKFPESNGQVRVVFWTFEKKLGDNHLFCIPEFVLFTLNQNAEHELFKINRAQDSYYVLANNTSLNSIQSSMSLTSDAQYAFSLGAPFGSEIKEVYEPNFTELIKKNIKRLTLNSLPGFYVSKKRANEGSQLSIAFFYKLLGGVIASWIIYAVVLSALLNLQLSSAEEKLATSRTEIGELLVEYQDVANQVVLLNQQINEFNRYPDINYIVSVLSKTIQGENVNFRRMSITQDKIIVVLEALSASEYIATLKSQAEVANAKLQNDVRKVNGNFERFTVEFKVRDSEVNDVI